MLLRLSALLLIAPAHALKEHDFRKCGDTPFCKLHRSPPSHGGFEVDVPSVAHADNVLTARLRCAEAKECLLPLRLAVSVLASGAVRAQIEEDSSVALDDLDAPDPAVPKPAEWDDDMDGEWVAPRVTLGRAVKARFRPEHSFASTAAVALQQCSHVGGQSTQLLRCASGIEVEVRHAPLSVAVKVGGQAVAELNGRGLLRFEHYRQQRASEMAEAPPPPEQHTFGSFTDPLPFGSSSVGLDVSFPRATHSYGLPERTVAHALPSTLGKEPYRLFNLDVFEYVLDHPMTVYGSVPFLHAHGSGGSYGALWLNPSETFVDLGCPEAAGGDAGGVCSHWFSASGVVDVFLFAGATPAQVTRQHAALTGTTPLPPLFALGYHQCRWNYKDEEDVSAVHAKFDEHNLPFDVLWLDIEHTDRKRYFTWNEDFFPTPLRMQQELARTGRKMVTIIDPHLRAEDDYAVYAAAKEQSLLVRTADNSSHFEGDCWPGRSAWVDYLQPAARAFWASRFLPDAYAGSSATLYTWNDMNEPSVFDGPEITMPPTLLHHDEHGRFYEHRELHNMYGLLMHMATFEGQQQAYPDRRPFVLTRAFFSGSQRYAAVWTGDNKASWAHLAASTPMLLSLSVAGIPFVGADVGGFFGNPDPALLVRWYQAAVFHPFLRAHAEFKTKRREPWLFGDEVTRQVGVALRLRYTLLPYLYTLFAEHAKDGSLVMRPMWHEFPEDAGVRGPAWWAPEPPPKEEEEAAAGEAAQADGEEAGAAEGGDGGERECSCYKCDDSPCYAPHCSSCGPKESSGCRNVNGVAYPPWGCYRHEQAPCKCEKEAKYGGYGGGYGGSGRGRRSRYDDDDSDYDYNRPHEADGSERYDEEDEPEEVGECPCYWCSGNRCFSPDCATCGTEETSKCVRADGSKEEWGCYTSADDECSCNSDPRRDRYSGYSESRYDDDYKYRADAEDEGDYDRYRDGKYDDDDYSDDKYRDDEDHGGTDYNKEYYEGDAGKAEDQDEGQPQTAEQFMLGPLVLVQPITAKVCETTQVYLPASDPAQPAVWYDLHTLEALTSTPGQRVLTLPVHPDRVPSFLRGGAVLPRRDRPRRSSAATHSDPFTLLVGPDAAGAAAGSLYLDAYDGYAYQSGAAVRVGFTLASGTLVAKPDHAAPPQGVAAAASEVERVVFLGQSAPRRALVHRAAGGGAAEASTAFDAATGVLTVHRPRVRVGEAFSIELVE